MKTLVEFLLWDNCNNHCKFCFLKEHNPCPSFLSDVERVKSIQSVKSYIDVQWKHGDDILLCGGELFDYPMTPQVQSAWDNLIETILEKVEKGIIDEVYINTNMLYDINLSLVPFLFMFAIKGLLFKLRFTTSYDLYGRFKTEGDRCLFLTNVNQVKSMFPGLEIIANTVLTKNMCDEIANGFKVTDVPNVTINLIPYIILTDDMAPNKSMVMQTLKTVEQATPGYVKGMLTRFTLDKPRKLMKYYNGELSEMTSKNLECGHSENFTRYTKEGSCFICDLIELGKEIYG